MLPVALVVHWYMGGPRPGKGDYLGCAGILAGLGLFLVLIGEPHSQHVPRSRFVGMAVIIILVAGALLCVAVSRLNAPLRGAVYGGVAGAYFGTIAVMVDGTSDLV